MQVNKLRYLLLATLFLLPLLQANNNYGYEHIKILFFLFSISLIGIFWTYFLFKKKLTIQWTKIKLISLTFITVLLINSFFGLDIFSSLLGVDPYFQGWIVYAYLFLLSLMVSSFKLSLIEIALVFAFSSVFVSMLAIKQWIEFNLLQIPIPNYAGRVVSSFGQPNFFAGFLLLILPFCYFLFTEKDRRIKIIGWVSGLAAYIGIIISYSRTAIFFSLLMLSLVLWSIVKIKILRKFNPAIFLPVLLLILIFISIQISSGFIYKEFYNPLNTNNPDLARQSIENRLYIWPQVVKIGLQKPFGYGLENIDQAYSLYFQTNKYTFFETNPNYSTILVQLTGLKLNRTHNYLLDLFLFSGWLSVFCWTSLIVILYLKIQKLNIPGRNIYLVSLITYLVWVQFQNQSIVQLVYFWLLVGIIDSSDSDLLT